jgi:ribosomal protein L24
MAEKIKNGDMVQFTRGGMKTGMKGQVKRVYDWTPTVRVLIIPDMHQIVCSIGDCKKI